MQQLRDHAVQLRHVAGGAADLLQQGVVRLDVDRRAVGAHPLFDLFALEVLVSVRSAAAVAGAAASALFVPCRRPAYTEFRRS